MNWLGVATTSFKKDAEGRDLFFPWGKLGRGRLVPSKAARVWVKLYLGAYLVCVVVIVGPLVVAGKIMRHSLEPSTFSIGALICVAVVVVPLTALWLRVRAWPVAADREMTIREAIATSAEDMGPVFLWVGIVSSGIMTALGIFLLVASGEIVGAIMVVALFGAAFGFFIWMLRARKNA